MGDDQTLKGDDRTLKGDDEILVSARDVSKVYRMGDVEVHALRHLNLDIARGELLMIVGPSGSGKSTLLNLLGGMDRPTSGQLLFEGTDLSRASDHQLTMFRRSQVGFVFQFFNLIPTLTAAENVQVAVQVANRPLKPMEALEVVGLTDRAHFFPSQMSGGQQQRVAIARALAANPPFLLCDEPTGNLDSDTGRQVLELLVKVNREMQKTLVVITHSAAVAAVGHRVAHIRDGSITNIVTNPTPVRPEEIEW